MVLMMWPRICLTKSSSTRWPRSMSPSPALRTSSGDDDLDVLAGFAARGAHADVRVVDALGRVVGCRAAVVGADLLAAEGALAAAAIRQAGEDPLQDLESGIGVALAHAR